MRFVRGLSCMGCGQIYEPSPTRYLCDRCGPKTRLDVLFDYEKIKKIYSREKLEQKKEAGLWRYLPLLPVDPDKVETGLKVGGTPVYESSRLGRKLGLEKIIIKDEGLNPTGSLKDRPSALAVVKAREAGAEIISCSSTGNAASSLAGNAAAGGMQAVIFVPRRAPAGKLAQLQIYGALVISVQGSYGDAYALSDQAIEKYGWYNRNAGINPYLVEGKKTATLELMEQLQWEAPDWIVLTVGDGCTIAGAGKALHDLKSLGYIQKIPRLLGVQAAGCAPITRAWRDKTELEPCSENSLADSIAVGAPRNWQKAVRAIEDTEGNMINVEDEEILEMMVLLGRSCGVFGEPAGVGGLAGVRRARESGLIGKKDTVAVIITGNGLKDIENAKEAAGGAYSLKPEIDEVENILIREGLR